MSLLSLRQRMVLDLPMRIQDHDATHGLTRNRGRGGAALDGAFGAGVAEPTKLAHRRGYYFDGGDHLQVANSPLVDFAAAEDFTLLAVLFDVPFNGAQSQRIMDKREGGFAAGNAGYSMGVKAGTGELCYGIGDGTNWTSDSTAISTSLVINRFCTVGITVSRAAAETTGYVDGRPEVVDDISAITGSLENASDLILGKQAYANSQWITGNLYGAWIAPGVWSALDVREFHYWMSRLCGRAREAA